jgi:hypothetical protein
LAHLITINRLNPIYKLVICPTKIPVKAMTSNPAPLRLASTNKSFHQKKKLPAIVFPSPSTVIEQKISDNPQTYCKLKITEILTSTNIFIHWTAIIIVSNSHSFSI